MRLCGGFLLLLIKTQIMTVYIYNRERDNYGIQRLLGKLEYILITDGRTSVQDSFAHPYSQLYSHSVFGKTKSYCCETSVPYQSIHTFMSIMSLYERRQSKSSATMRMEAESTEFLAESIFACTSAEKGSNT